MARLLAAVGALAVVAPATQAELAPTPLPGDARLVTFDFDPDNTYLILSKPRAVTHLEFPEGETILTIAAGDTANWELTPTQNRRHLFIKPKVEQNLTSMTVLTDKRSYQFVIRATAEGQKWYQRVTWRVPVTLMLDGPAAGAAVPATPVVEVPVAARANAAASSMEVADGQVRPEDLKFDYSIEGDAPFRPVQVFDNDRMTWVRLPPNVSELPVVLALDTGGEFVLVNYMVRGDLLLVQRVMERFVLKIGRTEVRISRGAPRRGWWGARGGASNGGSNWSAQ